MAAGGGGARGEVVDLSAHPRWRGRRDGVPGPLAADIAALRQAAAEAAGAAAVLRGRLDAAGDARGRALLDVLERAAAGLVADTATCARLAADDPLAAAALATRVEAALPVLLAGLDTLVGHVRGPAGQPR